MAARAPLQAAAGHGHSGHEQGADHDAKGQAGRGACHGRSLVGAGRLRGEVDGLDVGEIPAE
jgi:hypothetical protein